MDSEFPVRNKHVDLCLRLKGFPKILVEVKDLGKDLNNYVSQAINYVFDLESSVDKVILVNGNEFRYYKCNNIRREETLVFEWKRSELSNPDMIGKIINTISKKVMEEDFKQYELDNLTLPTFLDKFNEWKILLFKYLSKQIREKYASNTEFKEKIDWWIGYRSGELSLDWHWREERKIESVRKYISEILTKSLGTKIIVSKNSNGQFWKNYRDNLYQKKIDDILRNNGIVVDIFDKFALEASYLFLNRILFLRMAEDYNFLPYKIFSPSWIVNFYKYNNKRSIYHQIASCLSEIDENFPIIYQYPLFDNIYFEELEWSKSILIKIIEEIILPDFTTAKRDLIGQLYEKSIDKNTRKLLGQFYTDPIIVKFMLSKLENIDEEKSILDPACGSGTFLKTYYEIIEIQMIKKGYSKDDIPKILAEKIWGFDIDPFAVQLTSIQLIIQNFRKALKKRNIYNINSLISKLNEEFKKRLNIGILAIKFDYIVGNPPFFVVNTDKQPYRTILRTGDYQDITTDNINIASMFLFKYSNKLKENGQLAFIFPRSFLHVSSFNKLRKEILEKKIQYIYDLGKAFENVGLQQLIIILKNEDITDNTIHYGLLDFNGNISEKLSYEISQDYVLNNDDYVFEVFSGLKPSMSISGEIIKEKIKNRANGKNVDDYCEKIQRGLGFQSNATSTRKSNTDLIIIGGRSIFNYGKKGTDTYSYIDKKKIIIGKMPDKIRRNLYQPKITLQNLVSSKIRIVGCYDDKIIKKIKLYNILEDREEQFNIYTLTFDTITNLYPKEEKYARFLLAILTSDLITYYLRDFIFIRQTLTIHLDKKYLEKIPVVQPNDTELAEIRSLVEELETFAEQNQIITPVSARSIPDWENPSDSRYNTYSQLIDNLNKKIYKLYGLNNQEIDYIKMQLNEFDNYY